MLVVVLMCVSGILSDLEWSAGILSHACTSTLTCGTSAGLGTVEGLECHELDKLGSCQIIFLHMLASDCFICVS